MSIIEKNCDICGLNEININESRGEYFGHGKSSNMCDNCVNYNKFLYHNCLDCIYREVAHYVNEDGLSFDEYTEKYDEDECFEDEFDIEICELCDDYNCYIRDDKRYAENMEKNRSKKIIKYNII